MQLRCSTVGLTLLIAACSPHATNSAAPSAPKASTPSTETIKPPAVELMPLPADVEVGSGRLEVLPSFSIVSEGHEDARLQSALERLRSRLRQRVGFEIARARTTTTLTIACKGAGLDPPSLEDDESYRLETSTNAARLEASSVVGVLRGIETFLQLVRNEDGRSYVPVVRIDDRPRFRWRGLLLDPARHWLPVETIKRELDGMAAVKLNVLHWHLSDDQAFRVESRLYPRLHEMGSGGKYYTQAQLKDVVAYARDRGIRVIPEFDVPAHTASWLTGYPELAPAPGPYPLRPDFGLRDEALDPTRDDVYRFVERFFGEMIAIFPDAYFHIGGDEVVPKRWYASPAVRTYMQRHGLPDASALQASFNRRIEGVLAAHHRKMVGWDEIRHPDLPRDLVIQSWRGSGELIDAVRDDGFFGILSSGYYLNVHEPAGVPYLVDPLPDAAELTAEQASRILGAEACEWGEFIDENNLDVHLWPRLAAVSERYWSPRDRRDVSDMYRRLSFVERELERVGIETERSAERLRSKLVGSGGGATAEALKTFAEAVRPSYVAVASYAPFGQDVPLSRFIDTIRVDGIAQHRLATWVDDFLDDAPSFQANRADLASTFTRWQELPAKLQPIARSPSLAGTESAREALALLGRSAEEAIAFIAKREPPPGTWTKAQRALLTRATAAQGNVRIAVLPALTELFQAASSIADLKTTTPTRWRSSVRRAASL